MTMDWKEQIWDRISGVAFPDSGAAGPLSKELLDLVNLQAIIPPDVLDLFGSMTEEDLESESDRLEVFIWDNTTPESNVSEGEVELLLSLGARIRAVDAVLSELQGWTTRSDFTTAWLYETDSNKGYVIPRSKPRIRFNDEAVKGPKGAFAHRVLKKHRVLPFEISGYPLHLHLGEGEFGVDLDKASYGAGLFSDIDLEIEDEGEGFLVTEIKAHDFDKALKRQLEFAHRDKCNVLTFPEFTISPSSVDAISDGVSRRPWDSKVVGQNDSWTVSIIVAGSWHHKIDGQYYNMATVMDGYGDVLLSPKKIMPYFDRALNKSEAIKSGAEINVLVMEDIMIAFGICRDFCERALANPFPCLDVDLFLVPSCGSEVAMDGHRDTAKDVNLRFKARSFVVQQEYPPTGLGDGNLGFVLSPFDTLGAKTSDLRVSKEWTCRRGN